MQAKVAIVTGGARGIGRGCALELARQGFDIALVDLLAPEMERTRAELEALGRQLGSAAVEACEAVRDPTSTRPSQEPEGDLAGPVGAASRQIELPLEPNDAGRATWPAEVQVLRIGGVYLVGLPGEVFLEIGRRAQQAVAGAVGLPAERVLVQGYSNGSIGYVPTAAAIPEGGYEVGAWKMSDRPAGFTGDAERLLADTAATLAAHLVG